MKNCIFNTGRRIEYFIAMLVFHFPCWLMLLKTLSWLMLVCIQYFIFKILQHVFYENTMLNLLLSIFIINFPLYVLWLEPIMFSYTFCEFLFFAAISFYFQQTTVVKSFPKKIIAFLPIALLLFFSFEIQSFYVFTYSFLLVLFVRQYDRLQSFLGNVIRFTQQHFLLLLFPIFSFLLWNKLFPINGMAKSIGYNQINLSLHSLAYHFAFSNFKLFIALPYLLAQLAIHNPFTTIISGVVGFVVFSILFKKTFPFAAWRAKNNFNAKNAEEIQRKERKADSFIVHRFPLWLILLIAAVFLIAALLPYSIVGKDYGALNRNCRNGLLAGFGIVFLVVMLIEKYVRSHRARFYLYASIFSIFSIGSNLSYIYWQAYYVRFQKAQQLFAENVSNFKSDYLVVTESGNNPMHQHFTSYEMNFMLKETVRSERFLTMESTSIWANQPDSFLTTTQGYRRIFMYNDFNNKTDAAVHITLQSAPNAMIDVEKIVWQYWINGCDAKDYPMVLAIRK